MQFDGWRFRRCYPGDWRSPGRRRLKSQWSFRWDLRRQSCRCTSSRFVREKDTSGRRDIGRGTTTTEIITGCGEPGRWRPKLATYGRPDIMAGATPDADITVDGGIADIFTTTAQ